MPTLLSRGSNSNVETTQRALRKATSFMSLRRDSSRPAYFDAYPKAETAGTRKSSSRDVPRALPPKPEPILTEPSPTEDITPESSPSYTFPSFDSASIADSFFGDGEATPRPYARTRSCTGPSGSSNRTDSYSVPQLRFSGSSAHSHYETPPPTPDSISFRGFEESVTVATMDALVDGMNGGRDTDSGISSHSRFAVPGHHPLYQPPLPTPPPGVVLGGGKLRTRAQHKSSRDLNSGDEEEEGSTSSLQGRPRRRKSRPSSRSLSATTSIASPEPATIPQTPPLPMFTRRINSTPEKAKTVPLSISEIIRSHAPREAQVRSRPSTERSSSLYTHSQSGHGVVLEEPEMEPLTADEEAEFISRSSVDSIADEVRRTLRNQNILKVTPPPPSPRPYYSANRSSFVSETGSGAYSPRSVASSLYSSSAPSSHYPSSPQDINPGNFMALTQPSPSQAVAQYLRSARLTTLLKLTRSPHASPDNPLTVSLSDLGDPSGFPVVVFLGLGCVRHIMGLYDEMAELVGLRLLTIDRWGLGRTEPRAKAAKGIMQWASVVEEVLDLLHIRQCSVMAHSAGAPYALSFANKLPDRIRGDICLLAPWVGGAEGTGSYKWLKYVPNGILKTAQAAEWKLQAWMIGKPPTIAYEGIGYNAHTPSQNGASNRSTSPTALGGVYPTYSESHPRPSVGSNFSEYDDLKDFDGRFESRSTLGVSTRPTAYHHGGSDSKIFITKRKSSRGFLDRLKGTNSSNPQPQSPSEDKPPSTGGRRLKALRSMGSLKGKSASQSALSNRKSCSTSPQALPPPSLQLEIGLGFDDLNWKSSGFNTPEKNSTGSSTPPQTRSGGRRSLSFNSPYSDSHTQSPVPSAPSSPFITPGPSSAYQAALGNALIAASHAESAKGTHNDLLQILNHENHPWGFSYSAYPHSVRVWYGDRDEKIAENAVRWMEQNMGQDRCYVQVVKGADHSLMYKSGVVVEVFEQLRGFW